MFKVSAFFVDTVLQSD